ncbi:hypothetical protein KC887_03290 [Candidatus Kaiserbacteria bacterium]|nr:hypothetical protein [Candidatus Kaiserbacteria bacterium]
MFIELLARYPEDGFLILLRPDYSDEEAIMCITGCLQNFPRNLDTLIIELMQGHEFALNTQLVLFPLNEGLEIKGIKTHHSMREKTVIVFTVFLWIVMTDDSVHFYLRSFENPNIFISQNFYL